MSPNKKKAASVRRCVAATKRRSDKQKIAEAFALGNVDGLALDLTPDYNLALQTMQPVIVWDKDFGTGTLRILSGDTPTGCLARSRAS